MTHFEWHQHSCLLCCLVPGVHGVLVNKTFSGDVTATQLLCTGLGLNRPAAVQGNNTITKLTSKLTQPETAGSVTEQLDQSIAQCLSSSEQQWAICNI